MNESLAELDPSNAALAEKRPVLSTRPNASLGTRYSRRRLGGRWDRPSCAACSISSAPAIHSSCGSSTGYRARSGKFRSLTEAIDIMDSFPKEHAKRRQPITRLGCSV